MPLVIDERTTLGGILLTCTLATAGCTSDDGAGGITVESARQAAADAGSSPAECPIPFDVSTALPGSPSARAGEVEVETSETTTPAADPLAAQRDQGMSALDAAAMDMGTATTLRRHFHRTVGVPPDTYRRTFRA
jgi:hypothetical protein